MCIRDSFYVTVEEEKEGKTDYKGFDGVLVLKLSNLPLTVYSIDIGEPVFQLEKYVLERESGGYVVKPVYTLKACANFVGGVEEISLPITFYVAKNQSYIERKTVFIDSDPEKECAIFTDIALPPSRTKLPIVLELLNTRLTLEFEASLEGYIIYFPEARGTAVGSENIWNLKVTQPISVEGYFESKTEVAKVSGKLVSSAGEAECGDVVIDRFGYFNMTCWQTLSTANVSETLSTAKLYVEVADPLGQKHTFTQGIQCSTFDPSRIATLTFDIYDRVINVLFYGTIALATLLIFSYFLGVFTRVAVFNVDLIASLLISAIIMLLLLYFGIPYAYRLMIQLLHSIPAFSEYIDLPKTFEPKELFVEAMSYYDKLLSKMEEYLDTYFTSQLQAVLGALSTLVVIGMAFIGASMLASVSPGAGIAPGSIGGSLLMIVASILSIVLMLGPGVATIIALIVVARMFLILITAIVMVAFLLGVVFSLFPSDISRTIGAELVGAGLMFLIIAPLLGPLSYAFYCYAMNAVSYTHLTLPTN